MVRRAGEKIVSDKPLADGTGTPPVVAQTAGVSKKKRVELPVVDKREEAPPCSHHAPLSKATPTERQSLVDLRSRVNANEGKYTYNAGKIDVLPDGRVSFVDLTMDQVPLAMAMSTDEKQQARLSEFRVDWPGGADELQRPGSYVELAKSGELRQRIEALKEIRAADKAGAFKRAGVKSLKIGGFNLNVGEEKPISGTQGSGTVYFSGCGMSCNFCQYNDISQLKGGADTKVRELSEIMLNLQDRGAHNIQLMTPSHLMPEILEAVEMAAKKGLKIPLAYNTGGYEDLDALKQLDGVVDIYMPDFKFGTDEAGKRYGRVDGYAENAKAAIAEMVRQVGSLHTDERGVATHGVLVRHLVMPNNSARADEVAKALASISPDLEVHLMDQWTPGHLTFQTPEIHRPVTREEYAEAVKIFREAGFKIEENHAETGV